MKIITWNVNGVRAVAKKGFINQVNTWNADIICLQETKAQDDEVHGALADIKGYNVYPHSAVRKGYSGTCIMTKEKPLNVTYGIGINDHDQEGRTITSEFNDFYLVTSYIPNSGSELARLDYRQLWDRDFQSYLTQLQMKKSVIACGDFNVAHQPIDLARPKENYNKTSGYTQKEIDGMSALLKAGFTDIYRHLRPNEVGYSWWSARFGARAKNIGWRIDYFIVSNDLITNIVDSFILPDEMGSDHCPVVLITK
ncbi:MAG TPA: exodeoxyribonuclease III [Saprospiraceae bacterium]|nr:exodeoxyribonuclease III [Saprospiraceae bacterium]